MSTFDKDVDKFLKDTKEFTNMKRLPRKKVVDIGNEFVEKVKEEVARGLSPITRKKFPKYINPEKYPGRRKAAAPVNLELTGKMLADLKINAIITSGKDISILLKYASKKSQDKELGHRAGAGGQPKRPTLPEGQENFSPFLIKQLEANFKALIEKFDV